MKYLRLTGINNKGKIESNFREDINIEENSKIALLNASFSLKQDGFTITTNNDEIQYNDTKTS